jgi:hypothetical protein
LQVPRTRIVGVNDDGRVNLRGALRDHFDVDFCALERVEQLRCNANLTTGEWAGPMR